MTRDSVTTNQHAQRGSLSPLERALSTIPHMKCSHLSPIVAAAIAVAVVACGCLSDRFIRFRDQCLQSLSKALYGFEACVFRQRPIGNPNMTGRPKRSSGSTRYRTPGEEMWGFHVSRDGDLTWGGRGVGRLADQHVRPNRSHEVELSRTITSGGVRQDLARLRHNQY